MKQIELLAPAGSVESVYAAINAGADAIYIGGDKFSARAYASNFNEENLRKVVKYCHLYGVKVYITVNTIMKEEELNKLFKYIKFLYSINVDALIVQDTAIIKFVKDNLPNMPIHASTQMTIHNGEGALFLKKLGVERIVLSRELSLKEIEYISKNLNIETEIFVHGALCVCYSGQCLMSSLIGGRSGNRGRCAQPCRLEYTLSNKINNKAIKGYLLSPKDICLLENLEDIIKSGTSSLKIEGRMKRPEYVAGVVSIYRKNIDKIYKNEKINKDEILKDLNVLKQLFNREGFSKAYLYENVGKDMMAYNFGKNTGVEIGKVEKEGFIKLINSLNIGDGVRIKNNGFVVKNIIKEGKEVSFAKKGDRIKIKPNKYKKGDIVYKTSDVNLFNDLEKYYKNPYMKRINLDIKVKFKINKPFEIITNYNNKNIKVIGNKVEKALKSPIKKEKLNENLTKTKDTPFDIINIKYEDFEEGFLPISVINQTRRKLIDEVEKEILKNYKYDKNEKKLNSKMEEERKNKIDKEYINYKKENICLPKELIYVNTQEQIKAANDLKFKDIAINIFNKNSDIDMESLNQKVYIKIPNIIKEEFNYICSVIEKNGNNIKGIVTSNIGIINKFKDRFIIIGDYKLNIFNSFALNFYEDYINLPCLSVELNKNEIFEICKNINIPIQALIYGKIELMVSEYCAIGSTFGGKSSCNTCYNSCINNQYELIDRKNKRFLINTDKFCRSYIYNCETLNLIDNIRELKSKNVKHYRLDFYDENYEETLKILKAFREEGWKYSFEGYTRGHYKRGVE